MTYWNRAWFATTYRPTFRGGVGAGCIPVEAGGGHGDCSIPMGAAIAEPDDQAVGVRRDIIAEEELGSERGIRFNDGR